ncbi:hypothetical protein R6Q59_035700 [Mikania micrantha]
MGRRRRCFASEDATPEKMVRRRRWFAGEDASPEEMLRRSRCFAGEDDLVPFYFYKRIGKLPMMSYSSGKMKEWGK